MKGEAERKVGIKCVVLWRESNSEALWASWHMVIRILGEPEFEALWFFLLFYFVVSLYLCLTLSLFLSYVLMFLSHLFSTRNVNEL